MNPLRFTLVADGPTDAVLLHPLKWLLISGGVARPIECAWADLRQLPKPPINLQDRIAVAIDLYPCDLVFIHRDAEREPRANRVEEIGRAVRLASADLFGNRPYVCVVPVRMSESWLLFDEAKIRRASGNPSGTCQLEVPPLHRVEDLPDPKSALHDLLRKATELPVRRLKKFSPEKACHRLAELIDDFSPLRRLPAFLALEQELSEIVQNSGWTS